LTRHEPVAGSTRNDGRWSAGTPKVDEVKDDPSQQGVLNVKAFAVSSICLLAWTSAFASQAFAQGTPTGRNPARPAANPASTGAAAPRQQAAPTGGLIAVVDISYLFKNHAGFKAKMEEMKKQVQEYDTELRGTQQALSQERERLSQFRPGSPEYDKFERELADKAAKLQVDMQLKKKDFLEREAKVYYQVYVEIYQQVREFADMNGIDMVLRHTGDEIDPNDRNSVLQGVNRALVYHRDLDITGQILDRLNREPRVSRAPANKR
jgi:Skp family chaperone for outer membrane proteins